MLQIKTLGIFDSGLGGYSVYHDLKTQFPQLDMVMFADQVNAPYGNRSVEEIQKLALEAMFWFQQQGINSVLIACNTVSAVALDFIRGKFPEMNLWGIIDLTVSQVEPGQSVKVVATQATIDSNAYPKALTNNKVSQCALTNLVSLIEGLEDDRKIVAEINKCSYTEDVVILGCTHYPLVRHLFEKSSDATILDSFVPIRQFVKKLYLPSVGHTKVYTSGNVDTMTKQIKTLFELDEEVASWNLSF